MVKMAVLWFPGPDQSRYPDKKNFESNSEVVEIEFRVDLNVATLLKTTVAAIDEVMSLNPGRGEKLTLKEALRKVDLHIASLH